MTTRALLLPLAAASLGACATAPPSGNQSPALVGTRWTIEAIDGAPAKTMRLTEVRFTADRIEGNAGCNSFGGNYSLSQGKLTARQIISTKMACLGPGMDVESGFFRILNSTPSVTWQGRDHLTLTGGGHSAVLRRL